MDEPHVYLLHGEDDFAKANLIREIQARLGDPVMLDMNTIRLDGRSNTLENVVQAVNSMPFLAPQRLVFFHRPTAIIKHPTHQKKLLDIFNNLLKIEPPTTVLVMTEDEQLLPRDKKKDPVHWLEKWAKEAGPAVHNQVMNVPAGADLQKWIIGRVKVEGGQITPPAAAALSEAIGPEPRILTNEIQKLLAYVNYARPIEREDVEHVAAPIQRVENFALLNALRAHNLQMALKALRLELDQRDPIMVFSGIVGQFRNLLLAREMLDTGGRPEDLAAAAKINPYVAKLAMEQARGYKLNELEDIYHQLIELDEMMKGGSSDPEAALDVMVTKLTLQ